LGVVGEGPCGSVEAGDHSGLGGLRHFAVVGGVGLTGDDEDLSDADVLDGEEGGVADGVGCFDFYAVESAGDDRQLPTELLFSFVEREAMPSAGEWSFDGGSFDSRFDARD
jgi:hypothetical protein